MAKVIKLYGVPIIYDSKSVVLSTLKDNIRYFVIALDLDSNISKARVPKIN